MKYTNALNDADEDGRYCQHTFPSLDRLELVYYVSYKRSPFYIVLWKTP